MAKINLMCQAVSINTTQLLIKFMRHIKREYKIVVMFFVRKNMENEIFSIQN